jgi:hypothetical protein
MQLVSSTTMLLPDKNKCAPWVEKYRPVVFDTIVLDDVKKFTNITSFDIEFTI